MERFEIILGMSLVMAVVVIACGLWVRQYRNLAKMHESKVQEIMERIKIANENLSITEQAFENVLKHIPTSELQELKTHFSKKAESSFGTSYRGKPNGKSDWNERLVEDMNKKAGCNCDEVRWKRILVKAHGTICAAIFNKK